MTKGLSVEEACQALAGCGRGRIYEAINSGELRSFKIGKRRIIPSDAVDEYLKRKEAEYQAAQTVAA
jgi:excisionase family DNA binding protein